MYNSAPLVTTKRSRFMVSTLNPRSLYQNVEGCSISHQGAGGHHLCLQLLPLLPFQAICKWLCFPFTWSSHTCHRLLVLSFPHPKMLVAGCSLHHISRLHKVASRCSHASGTSLRETEAALEVEILASEIIKGSRYECLSSVSEGPHSMWSSRSLLICNSTQV